MPSLHKKQKAEGPPASIGPIGFLYSAKLSRVTVLPCTTKLTRFNTAPQTCSLTLRSVVSMHSIKPHSIHTPNLHRQLHPPSPLRPRLLNPAREGRQLLLLIQPDRELPREETAEGRVLAAPWVVPRREERGCVRVRVCRNVCG